MTTEISRIAFPHDIEDRIQKIALKTGETTDEVKSRLMRTFFDLVDDTNTQDVPAFVQKVRDALKEVAGAG